MGSRTSFFFFFEVFLGHTHVVPLDHPLQVFLQQGELRGQFGDRLAQYTLPQ